MGVSVNAGRLDASSVLDTASCLPLPLPPSSPAPLSLSLLQLWVLYVARVYAYRLS